MFETLFLLVLLLHASMPFYGKFSFEFIFYFYLRCFFGNVLTILFHLGYVYVHAYLCHSVVLEDIEGKLLHFLELILQQL